MYAQATDILNSLEEARLTDVSNDSANPEEYNAELINTLISRRGVYIDSFLRATYVLPITDADDLLFLLPICSSLVVYDLFARKVISGIPETIGLRYDDAVATLNQIAKGTVSLKSQKLTSSEINSGYRVSKIIPYYKGYNYND